MVSYGQLPCQQTPSGMRVGMDDGVEIWSRSAIFVGTDVLASYFDCPSTGSMGGIARPARSNYRNHFKSHINLLHDVPKVTGGRGFAFAA